MRILDLFCGAGGASVGYARAGFEVVGVDIKNQPNYPFDFYRGDVFTTGSQLISDGGWDAIHASPPCQAYSKISKDNGIEYPDLVEPTRTLLRATGLPYIMENVELSPLHEPTVLCGSQFGLGVEFCDEWLQLQRHRWFESNVPLRSAGPCRHTTPVVGVYGKPGGSNFARSRILPGLEQWRTAMNIDWMSSREITQAIPPNYAEFLGNQLRERIERGTQRRAQPA